MEGSEVVTIPGAAAAIKAAAESRSWEVVLVVVLILAILGFAFGFVYLLFRWFLRTNDDANTTAKKREELLHADAIQREERMAAEYKAREERMAKRIDTLEDFSHTKVLDLSEKLASTVTTFDKSLQGLREEIAARLCLLAPEQQEKVIEAIATKVRDACLPCQGFVPPQEKETCNEPSK